MAKPDWVNYAKAAPILLPTTLLLCWRGFYLPTTRDDDDLDLPRQAFRICDDFDFKNPKTDYDRACAALLSSGRAVAKVRVGSGFGLVFAAVNGPITWWREQRMLVNGRELPTSPARTNAPDSTRSSTPNALARICPGVCPTPRARLPTSPARTNAPDSTR
jgi:hypothetical protein